MKGEKTWEQALKKCINNVRKHSEHKIPEALLAELRDAAAPKFKKNHHQWPKNREKVLLSARFVGAFAGHFADDDGVSTVSRKHLAAAVEKVRSVCPARLQASVGIGIFFAWCPSGRDFPGNLE
jgi:hypothetical protein